MGAGQNLFVTGSQSSLMNESRLWGGQPQLAPAAPNGQGLAQSEGPPRKRTR